MTDDEILARAAEITAEQRKERAREHAREYHRKNQKRLNERHRILYAKFGHRPRPTDGPPNERTLAIIAERERGLTYKAIGQDHGISGERVRQILQRAGRPDLCHYLPHVLTGQNVPCRHCGKPFYKRPSVRKKYCSKACWQKWCRANLTPRQAKMIEVVKRERAAGKTWKEAGMVVGYPHTTLCGYFKTVCINAGIDYAPYMSGRTRWTKCEAAR